MQKINPISEQSKKWLVKALMDLMKEKPYSSITIKEISDKAQLSRRTFYRNFNIKDDLLDQYAKYLFKEYMNCINSLAPITFRDVLITYFEFWSKHIKDLELLKQNHLFYVLMEQVSSFIPDINKLAAVEWHDYSNQLEEQYIGLYSIGGLWNVLSHWVDDKERKSSEEMAQIILKGISNFSKSIYR